MPEIDALSTGKKVGNTLNETLKIGGGATTAATPTVTIPRDTATTNTVEPLLRVQRTSSGAPANGIGASIEFEVETAAANNEIGASIEAVTTDVTATSEDFDLVFKTMAAGATAAERMRILSTGNLSFRSNANFIQMPFNGTFAFSNSSVSNVNFIYLDGTGAVTTSAGYYGFTGSATDSSTTVTTKMVQRSAGVMAISDGTNANTRYLMGGGAAVASAAALPLPTGSVFHVTGTTTITSITSTNFQSGVTITLIFDGILTVTDGGNLKLAGNFVTTADDTLTLAYDGTNWYEVCRSVN